VVLLVGLADQPDALLYLDGTAENNGNNWKIDGVKLGGPDDVGLNVELLAVLVSGDVGNFIRSISVVPLDRSKNANEVALWTADVPAASLIKDRIKVARGKDLGWCGE
jgi:hypothetical protein